MSVLGGGYCEGVVCPYADGDLLVRGTGLWSGVPLIAEGSDAFLLGGPARRRMPERSTAAEH